MIGVSCSKQETDVLSISVFTPTSSECIQQKKINKVFEYELKKGSEQEKLFRYISDNSVNELFVFSMNEDTLIISNIYDKDAVKLIEQKAMGAVFVANNEKKSIFLFQKDNAQSFSFVHPINKIMRIESQNIVLPSYLGIFYFENDTYFKGCSKGQEVKTLYFQLNGKPVKSWHYVKRYSE